ATAGLGGHTKAIAERLTTGRVIASDRDEAALELARENTAPVADRIRFVRARFSELPLVLKKEGIGKVDGLLADLGLSMFQIRSERGFSFSRRAPLSMKMGEGEADTPDAAELVNTLSEKELADLIYRLGEERRSRTIARAIVRARPVRDTLHLAGVIEAAVPRTGRLHPATLTFQALRRAVNREPEELDALLAALPDMVAAGGRVVVISFMSLEDRQVKEAFRELARSGRARLLTKHVVTPGDEEVRANAASRSAKLRALEMR
ncbi:MAG TPA: 16S rRNA (cytosine(1402)-N(4))-methyltransferase RsmH, partial [Bryobacteraceae bacterium]|nr:16S rRNA (cytosine(1402)-N(4))-methyltransferase RsmH [Bryobacteraceae bacterium]